MLESLVKSLTYKAKGKEKKVDTPKRTMNIVMQKTQRTSSLNRKKNSSSKTALVKEDTYQKSLVSKRRRVEKVNKWVEQKTI